jgi:hypothetical protein
MYEDHGLTIPKFISRCPSFFLWSQVLLACHDTRPSSRHFSFHIYRSIFWTSIIRAFQIHWAHLRTRTKVMNLNYAKKELDFWERLLSNKNVFRTSLEQTVTIPPNLPLICNLYSSREEQGKQFWINQAFGDSVLGMWCSSRRFEGLCCPQVWRSRLPTCRQSIFRVW